MSYTNEMSFSEWVSQAGARANSLVQSIEQGKILYDKWYQFSYGKTNADIAALPQFNKTEADIAAMAYALGVFKEMWEALHNVTVTQADRQGYLTPIL